MHVWRLLKETNQIAARLGHIGNPPFLQQHPPIDRRPWETCSTKKRRYILISHFQKASKRGNGEGGVERDRGVAAFYHQSYTCSRSVQQCPHELHNQQHHYSSLLNPFLRHHLVKSLQWCGVHHCCCWLGSSTTPCSRWSPAAPPLYPQQKIRGLMNLTKCCMCIWIFRTKL